LNKLFNLKSIFSMLIIAVFSLSLSGCGYKAPPYYQEDVPKSDKNVEFIMKKPTQENNEVEQSCEI